MLDLIHRERAVRGDVSTGQTGLPKRETWETLDFSVPNGFTVGRVVGARGRLRWHCRDDHSGLMVSGATGAGKSQLLGQLAPLPDLWNHHHGTDWGETWIFDPKGTGIYRAAQNLGAVLIDDMADMVDALRALRAETQTRNRTLGQMSTRSVDRAGMIHEGAEVSIWDLTPEQRAEYDLRPRAIFFDELADLLDPDPDDYPNGFDRRLVPLLMSGFSHFARKRRSAGLVAAVGNQRFDVKFIGGGLEREQFPSRIVLGNVSNDHLRMMFSDTEAKSIPPERLDEGHGWSNGIGGRGLSRMYVVEVKLSNYHPFEVSDDLTGPGVEELRRHSKHFKRYVRNDDPANELPATPVLDEQAAQVWAYLLEHPDSSRRQVHDALGIPMATLEKSLLNEKHGMERHRRLFVESLKGGPRKASLFRAAPLPTTPDDSPPEGGISEGVRGWQFGFGTRREEGWWWGFGQDCRAVFTGWAVRGLLYFWAWRLLWGPAEAGAKQRDPRVVKQAHEQGTGRCRLCGRRGELHVHHVRPLSFGGADAVGNTWLLCSRPGKASCHRATTAAEGGIRWIRRKTATLDGAAPPAFHKRLTPWLAVVHPDQVVLAVVFAAGLLAGFGLLPAYGWQALAAWAVAATVPKVWTIVRNKERLDPNHKATQRVDPGTDPEVSSETWWALREPGKWWNRHKIKKQRRKSKRARALAAFRAVTGRYSAGYLTPMVLPWVPAVLLGGLGVFL